MINVSDRTVRSWVAGATRNLAPIAEVTLNPERDTVVTACSGAVDTQPVAA